MGAQEKDNQDYGLYFIIAVIFGAATAWVAAGPHLGYILLGALIGLLVAGLFVNGIVKAPRD